MKNKIIFFFFSLACTFTASAQWTIDSLNTAGTYLYSAATNNKAVFSNGTQWNVFDAPGNLHTWGNLSVSRGMVRTASIDNKIYFGGGKYGSFADPLYTKNVDVYDAVTNSWSTLMLSKNREVGGVGATAGKIVFAGGTGRQDISGPVYMYATADIFDAASGVRTTGKLSKARSNIAAGASGNKIVFGGGWFWDFNYNVLMSNAVDIYDVSSNTWTKTTLSKGRENIAVAVTGTKIIFAGGIANNGIVVKNVDIYDVSNGTWSTTNLPTARYGLKSVVVAENAYFAGGMFDAVENEVDIYNTLTGSWSTIYLPVSLSGFSMSVINDKIYFAGGYISSSGSYSDLVQIYNPLTAIWTTENLSIPRNAIAAVTCTNKGFFAGGITTNGFPTNRVDIRSVLSPVAGFTASTTSVTAGGFINFTDQSTNNPTSWTWTFEGGTPSTSTDQNPSGIQYAIAGTYTVSLAASNGEGSNTIVKTNYISVTPAACNAPSGLNTTNVTSTAATLNWSAPSGVTKYKITWKISGNNPWTTTTVTANTKTITGLTPNTQYTWKVKSICAQGISSPFSSDQSFTTSLVKLQQPAETGTISIYPNPASNELIISTLAELPAHCYIYNMYGQVVREFVLSDNQQSLDISGFPSGNYLLRVIDATNNSLETKMIKQ
jgi:PKD repeat protein